MLNTLRQRLILSHILPLLVIIPIVGIALIYTLETTVLLPDLATELTSQARLVGELAKDRSDIWSNPGLAEAFVNDMNRYHQNIYSSYYLIISPHNQQTVSEV